MSESIKGLLTLSFFVAISSAIFFFWCIWTNKWIMNVLNIRTLIWTFIFYSFTSIRRPKITAKNFKCKWALRNSSLLTDWILRQFWTRSYYCNWLLHLLFSSAVDGVYNLQVNETSETYPAYCHMSNLSSQCGGGGWTLVMKLDPNKVSMSL